MFNVNQGYGIIKYFQSILYLDGLLPFVFELMRPK